MDLFLGEGDGKGMRRRFVSGSPNHSMAPVMPERTGMPLIQKSCLALIYFKEPRPPAIFSAQIKP